MREADHRFRSGNSLPSPAASYRQLPKIDILLAALVRRKLQNEIKEYPSPRLRQAKEGQRRAAALARSFLAQSARKSFISALSPRMRGATPLYFFVVPVIVRLTAP